MASLQSFNLDSWKLDKMSFSEKAAFDTKEESFSLRTSCYFPEDEENAFFVSFDLQIDEKSFKLDTRVSFKFKTSDDSKITQEFKLSNFPKVNAPAIAYPYLRSFISNFTLSSGYKVAILPTINFSALNQKQKEEQ